MQQPPSSPPHHASREDQARAEIGATEIRRPVAVLLVVLFVAMLVAGTASVAWRRELRRDIAAPFGGLGGALFHTFIGVEQRPGILPRLSAHNRALRERIGAFEDVLDDRFPMAVALRTPVQTMLAALGAGNEQVFIGRDRWLYYRPDVTALIGRGIAAGTTTAKQTDSASMQAIVEFHAQLAAHGVRLVLLPTPVKPAVHPEGLNAGPAAARAPNAAQRNPGAANGESVLRVGGYREWSEQLRGQGVEVFDAAPDLARARSAHGRAYLRGDTHWRPEAMEAVAMALAARLRPGLPESAAPAPTGLASQVVSQVGDTAMMLTLPDGHPLRARETVTTQPVTNACSEHASVVLLGDSFSNIFSLDGMGWGAHAGLAERLAWHLGQPVRPFLRNDGGAWASRERFAQAVARGDVRLADVRVVVWQFAERELVHGDWRSIPLAVPAAEPNEDGALPTLLPRGTAAITGSIAAVSEGPRRDAPYADFVLKWHVRDLRDADGNAVAGLPEAVVLTLGMRQRTILPSAALRPGIRVDLAVRPWSTVEAQYGKLNAGTLDDPMVELELPLLWADSAGAVP
jgi:alginate O-acetyltransferase complex protein AlgJ